MTILGYVHKKYPSLLLETDETYEGCVWFVEDEGYGGCITLVQE